MEWAGEETEKEERGDSILAPPEQNLPKWCQRSEGRGGEQENGHVRMAACQESGKIWKIC